MRTASSGLIFLTCLALEAGAAGANPSPPDPAASGSPDSATPLREIGHVRATTPFCQAVFDEAGFSTATALSNDKTILETADMLKVADLDENAMAKPKTIADMQASYEALMARTKSAIEATKELRKLADQAPTPEQKAALIAYADALGGALHRQQIAARDYRQFGVYLEANDPISWQQHDEDLIQAAVIGPGPGNDESADARDRVPQPLADLAKAEAVHLNDLHELVINDEVHAAGNVDSAITPCSGPDAAPNH